MYDTNAVNAVTRAMRSEVSDHVTASEKKSLREVREEKGVFSSPAQLVEKFHC